MSIVFFRHRLGVVLRAAAMSLCVTACLAVPAAAEEEAASPLNPPPSTHRPSEMTDPISQVEGSADAWSVSKTDDGCYLMSPYRKGTSRLAIGRNIKLGLGLFAVGFAIALPGAMGKEPVTIEADGQELTKMGHLAGVKLLYVPLVKAEIEASLRELRTTGTLWLVVRHAGIVHGGQGIQAALTLFDTTCGDMSDTPG